MFEALKKKLFSFISGKDDKKKAKKSKPSKAEAKKSSPKAKAKEKQKPQKIAKKEPIKSGNQASKEPEKLTQHEKAIETQVDKIIKESETSLSQQSSNQEEKQEEEAPEEKGNFFTRLIKKITASKLKKEDFDEIFQDLEITLLENNVALEAVDKIKESLSSQLVDQQIKKTEAQARILQALKDSILELLIEPENLIEQINQKPSNEPYVIIFFGINGTGKTTSIAKLADMLKKQNISSVLAAADTFRAASIEQLEKHAQNLKLPIIKHQYGSDPAAVAYDSIVYAKKHNIKVVLIDTAGRMYTKENLLKEMEKIIRVSKPDLKIFVGESITGNDAIEQAKTFNEVIGIDGIILTKADVDEKAGTILSVSYITKKPIYFLGTGQEYKDLTPFTKKTVLKNLGLE